MNKHQTLPVEGVKVKKSQTEQFSDSLANILLSTTHTNPVILFADKLVQSATILTFSPLSGDQVRSLCNFAESWNQEIMIGRGQLGSIQIEFNLKSK